MARSMGSAFTPAGVEEEILNEREQMVLRAILERHIRSAEPVSSQQLCETCGWEWSSATVRNVMGRLENLGFLNHPYTSAGKTPTVKAYRYFIQTLMSEPPLSNSEQACIRKELNRPVRDGEDTMRLAGRLLAMLSHLLSVVWLPPRRPERFFGEEVVLEGASNLIRQPEFDDIQAVRQVVAMLDERETLARSLEAPGFERQGVRVVIHEDSTESSVPPLAWVMNEVPWPDGRSAQIGVLGPRRMAYNRIIPLVECTASAVREALQDSEKTRGFFRQRAGGLR